MNHAFLPEALLEFEQAAVYQVRPALILVVAIAHLRREPGYWASRWPPAH